MARHHTRHLEGQGTMTTSTSLSQHCSPWLAVMFSRWPVACWGKLPFERMDQLWQQVQISGWR